MQLNFLEAIEITTVQSQIPYAKPQKTTTNLHEFFSSVSTNTEKSSNKVIEDFGEKIGGAKKDLWRQRAMLVSDLDSMTDREAAKLVIKDHIWPKPDYEKMVKEGMDAVAVLLIKKIRDSLPAKVVRPSIKQSDRELREKYITFLSEVKTHIEEMNLTKPKYLCELKYTVLEGYYDFSNGRWLEKGMSHPALTNKFLRTLQVRSCDISKAENEVKKTGFPEKREAWRKNIHISYSETSKDYFIYEAKGYGNIIIAEGFCSEEDAEKFLEEEVKPKLKKASSKDAEPVRPQLKHIKRVGKDVRNGKDIDGNDLMETFKFRGGEFGVWTNQADRQQYLNYAYEGLMDLADVLGVDPSKISMGGELAIAFGARGAGRALAHYESTSIVINLTKMRGAGSLCHEVGHALDDYLGRIAGIRSFLTESRYSKTNLPEKVMSSFENLLDVIRTTPMKQEDMIKEYEKDIANNYQNIKRVIDSIMEELKKETGYSSKPRRAATEEEMKEALEYVSNIENNTETDNNLDILNKLYKVIKGRMINKDTRELLTNYFYQRRFKVKQLLSAQNGENVRTTDSNYLKDAKKIDKNRKKPYWSTNVELFARAFECFVYDELAHNNYRSDYLVHGVTNGKLSEFKAYPEGEEREKINEAFRELFKVLNEYDLL